MSVRILTGDCRDLLATMPAESVNCCVTSPPYFGLRDYGVDGQMGLEATPDEFVSGMVTVFREVRRVLGPDGTLWLNIGDSYTGSGKGGNPDPESSKQATNAGSQTIGCLYGTGRTAREAAVTNVTRKTFGLGPKQLLGIPWRLAFALQAEGWILRQDIIWSKPNPMPESVQDRCTKAHEYLFLLSKGPRYHYDVDAIRQAPSGRTDPIRSFGKPVYACGKEGQGGEYALDALVGANKRSVWEVATQPFSEAHFATFPPALIEPCILAGCPTGGTVLDPFFGAGTTGLVADRLGRDCIGIELNPEYAEIATRRLHADAGMFAEVQAA